MRYKFRAWDEENNEMIDGDSLAFEKYAPLVELLNQKGVMQYTGLKDTNDIEIYEEDIISTHKHDFVVKWDEIGGMYLFHEINNPDSGMDYYEFEENYSYYGFHVVGNIFENPELLEDK